ncbi:hypothetical protein BpHYR1_005642 [Brachionus plicatilis]|uniref:Uncharacterized protein n=1 Tax=Brachionus plicatilis TaxID=10195 RepID=A0A3M7PI24_BRAPC|nr:hypothetical protein BpHYR1_005642 [Brachionus plicatilis]
MIRFVGWHVLVKRIYHLLQFTEHTNLKSTLSLNKSCLENTVSFITLPILQTINKNLTDN